MTSGDTLAVDETSKTAEPRGPWARCFGIYARRRPCMDQMSFRILRADSGRMQTRSKGVDPSCSRGRNHSLTGGVDGTSTQRRTPANHRDDPGGQ
jgi:hypothetical protein